MADITVEDLFIERLTTQPGMTAKSYEAFMQNTSIPSDMKSKILKSLESGTVNAAKGLNKADVSAMITTMIKYRNHSFPDSDMRIANMSPKDYVKLSNQKYILDKKLGSPKILKGYMDPTFEKYTDVKPMSRLSAGDSSYAVKIGGQGDRVVPTSIPDDIYATTTRHIETYPKGSIDRITARLLFLTGDRAAEFSRLTVDSFDDVNNPTLDNSGDAVKNLKANVAKGRLSYFTDLERYYVLRARQLALLDGRKELFPNAAVINKEIVDNLKNTYVPDNTDASKVFKVFNERLGEYETKNPTRIFIRNLAKDRSGALFARGDLPQGDPFYITQNAINNQNLTHGIKLPVSMIKYMSTEGALRTIITPGMDILDNQYTAYSGYNSVESLLSKDGVINEYKNTGGKILIPETEIKVKHNTAIPAKDAILRHTYAMGWMPKAALIDWEQSHETNFAKNLNSNSSRLHTLDVNNAAYIDDAVSEALLNSRKRFAEASKLNQETLEDISNNEKFLEEEKIKRKTERKFNIDAERGAKAQESRDAIRGTNLTDEEIMDEQNRLEDSRPVRMNEETPRTFQQRLKAWRNGIGKAGLKALPYMGLLEPIRYAVQGDRAVEEQLAQFAIFPNEVPENYYTGERAKNLKSAEEKDITIRSNLMMEPASTEENVAELRQSEGSFLSDKDKEILDSRKLIYLDEQKQEVF